MKVFNVILTIFFLGTSEAMHASSLDMSAVANEPLEHNSSDDTVTVSLITSMLSDDSQSSWSEAAQHNTHAWNEHVLSDDENRRMHDYKLKLSEATLTSIHKNTRNIRASHEHIKLEAVIIKELIQHSKRRIDKIMVFCGMQVLLIFVVFILQTIFLIGNSLDKRKY